jgi:hypothetical protein
LLLPLLPGLRIVVETGVTGGLTLLPTEDGGEPELETLDPTEDKPELIGGTTEEARVTESTNKLRKEHRRRTAAKGGLNSLGLLGVRSSTVVMETCEDGSLVVRVDADTRGVGAGGNGARGGFRGTTRT